MQPLWEDVEKRKLTNEKIDHIHMEKIAKLYHNNLEC